LHAGQPIAGLRSSGKGANRTILDCLFRPIGREKWSFWKGFGIVTTASSADHPTRRDFLFVATGAAAAVGGAATLWPFISQMNPDASTIAAGAPIEVDLTPIAEGQDIKVFWRGKPIFISHRTKKEIDEAAQRAVASLPDPQPDQARVKEGPRPVARRDRHLHPSRLHPDRPSGQLRRLLLPLPRLAIRHLGPHPPGTRAGQPAVPPYNSSPTPRSRSAEPRIGYPTTSKPVASSYFLRIAS
jgi:hypothetical protein